MMAEYFTYEEMKCKCSNGCGNVAPMSKDFLQFLDMVREESGGPLYVTSGFRCRTHNTAIQGAEFSKHMEGIAADVYSELKSPKEIANIAMRLGLYCIIYDNFVHIDGRYL